MARNCSGVLVVVATKKSTILLLFALVLSTHALSAQNFELKIMPFYEAMEEATYEAKRIMVLFDHPTLQNQKDFLRDRFQEQSLKDFFDEHFIGVLLTPEKAKGLLPSKYHKFNGGYLFFFDAEGNLLHKVNYSSIENLGNKSALEKEKLIIERSYHALEPNKQYFTLAERYEQGERDPSFLGEHLLAFSRSGPIKKQAIVLNTEFLETAAMENYDQEKVLKILFETTVSFHEDAAMELRFNLDELYDLVPKAKVQKKLQALTHEGLWQGTDYVSDAKLMDIYSFAEMNIDPYKPHYSDFLKLVAAKDDEPKEYFEKATSYFDNDQPAKGQFVGSTVNKLLTILWDDFSENEQQEVLSKAQTWMSEAVRINPSYYNHEKFALVLLKAGEFSKAHTLLKGYNSRLHSNKEKRKETCLHEEDCFVKSQVMYQVNKARKAQKR